MPFHLTTTYQAGDVGGACFFCRSAQREDGGIPEPLFRTDTDFDGDTVMCADGHPVLELTRPAGNIVICGACAAELAGLIGWCSPDDMEAHTRNIDDAHTRADDAVARAERAEALVAALRAYDAAAGEPPPNGAVADAWQHANPEPEPQPIDPATGEPQPTPDAKAAGKARKTKDTNPAA